jgi:hypothetical protein
MITTNAGILAFPVNCNKNSAIGRHWNLGTNHDVTRGQWRAPFKHEYPKRKTLKPNAIAATSRGGIIGPGAKSILGGKTFWKECKPGIRKIFRKTH